jgi:uncharacterized membrane protein YbhN (UPF0104 family)
MKSISSHWLFMTPFVRRYGPPLLRLLISITLVVMIVDRTDWQNAIYQVFKIQWVGLFIIFFSMILSRLIGSFQLWLYFLAHRFSIRFFTIVTTQWTSQFYSTILPGASLSGSVITAYRLGKKNHDLIGVSSLLVSNTIAGLAWLMLGSGVILTFWKSTQSLENNFSLLFGRPLIAAGLIGLGSLLFFPTLITTFKQISNWKVLSVGLRKSVLFFESSCPKGSLLGNFSFLIVLWIFLVVKVFSLYVMAAELQIPLHFLDAFWLQGALQLISFFPFTFAGLGIREVGLVFLMTAIGFSESQAIALSVTIFGTLLIDGLMGFFIELFYPVERNKNS